jgi:hypothetical protein
MGRGGLMSWVKTDDRYDDTKKIKRAWRRHPRAVGLHAMSKSYSARHETDGLIDLDWLEDKLPDDAERAEVIKVMTDVGLYELLPAGESKRVRVRDVTVRFGPLDEDAYIVHDYLEFNEARCEAEARRAREAKRKADARARRGSGQSDLSVERPGGQTPDSAATPAGLHEVSALSRPDPTRPDPTPTRSTLPPRPPKGGRKRDHDLYDQQIRAWVSEHFPDRQLKQATGLTRHAMEIGHDSVEEIRAFVLGHSAAEAMA